MLVTNDDKSFVFISANLCDDSTFLPPDAVVARYCYRKLSVRLSVCDVDVPWTMCWVSSKVITPIISLGSSLVGATTSAI